MDDEKRKQLQSDLLSTCEVCRRYHQERARYLNSMNRFIQFLALSLPLIYVLSFDSIFDAILLPRLSLLIVTLIVLLGLIFDIVGQYTLHRCLYNSFSELYRELNVSKTFNRRDLNELEKKVSGLYNLEPSHYRALMSHCSNQVCLSINSPLGEYAPLTFRHVILRNVFRFQGTEFPNSSQINARLG